jgi:hypothetical protein
VFADGRIVNDVTQHGTDVQQAPERPTVTLIERPGRVEDHEADPHAARWRYSSALAAARALNVQRLARGRT